MVVVFLDLGEVDVDQIFACNDTCVKKLLQIARCCGEGIKWQRWRCHFGMRRLCVRRGRVGGVAVFEDRKQASDGGNERGKRFHAFEAGLGLVGASAAEPLQTLEVEGNSDVRDVVNEMEWC